MNTIHAFALVLPLAAACSARDNNEARVPTSGPAVMAPEAVGSTSTGASPDVARADGVGTPPMTALDGATAGPTLADSDIVEIVHIAHGGEIEQAKLALKRTKDARVKRFAEKTIKQHGDADAQAKALAERNHLVPTPSFVGTALASDGIQALSAIAATGVSDLDRTYLTAQIKELRATVEMVERELLPSAQLPELKDYLTSFRDTAALSLAEAQAIHATLPEGRTGQPPAP